MVVGLVVVVVVHRGFLVVVEVVYCGFSHHGVLAVTVVDSVEVVVVGLGVVVTVVSVVGFFPGDSQS